MVTMNLWLSIWIGASVSVFINAIIRRLSGYEFAFLYNIFRNRLEAGREVPDAPDAEHLKWVGEAVVGIFIAVLILAAESVDMWTWLLAGVVVCPLQFIIWVHMYAEKEGRYRVFVMLGLLSLLKSCLCALMIGFFYITNV